MEKYDVAIIGAGPAGLSAALYCARAQLKTLVFEKNVVGGLITQTEEIENYPGSNFGSTGFSLTQQMFEQAEAAGAEFAYEEICSLEKNGDTFVLKTSLENEYEARCIIIAGGTLPRLLGIKGEKEFRGRGVSYCATCDAGFFRGKTVGVVGGGDTAVKEADYLSRFADKVIVFHRRDAFRASKVVAAKVDSNSKVQTRYNTVVEEIYGNFTVEGVHTRNTVTGDNEDISLDGVFVFAGYIPNTELYKELLILDGNGNIITDNEMHTSCKGIFAAGDIRNTTLRQVITAASDGAVAAVYAEKFLSEAH